MDVSSEVIVLPLTHQSKELDINNIRGLQGISVLVATIALPQK